MGMFWRLGRWRQAAGGRDGLVEGGVQPVSLWIDQRRQRVDISRLELRELPVLEDEVDDGVYAPQGLKDDGVGGVA
jgi:hypothetical protein